MSTKPRLPSSSTPKKHIPLAQDEEEEAPVVGISIEDNFKWATYILFAWQILMIIILGSVGRDNFIGNNNFGDVYNMFSGVEIMMFFGFGYLMTFLKRYGMGAVGLTMLITVVATQWGMFTEWFFAMWYESAWTFIPLNVDTFIVALNLVAALLISFGGLIGKVSPLQLVIMTLLETVFYSINKSIFLVGALQFIDAGGSIQIHMFGAYFGLAASLILGKPPKGTEKEVNHVSDLMSLLGTLFLFIYWPSFNGGGLVPNSDQQQRAVIHTYLSLCAATVGTFVTSTYLNKSHKFRPVDIQNATLAGGVAIGAVCDLTLAASDCLIIGLVAGCVSTYGFNVIQPLLEEKIGLHDTCGIHNLHGLPSIIGGVASVFLTAYKGPRGSDMPAVFHHTGQGGIQLGAIVVTLLIAIPSGVFTGLVMRKFGSFSSTENFTDYPYWEVEPWEEGEHADVEKGPSSAAFEKVENGPNESNKVEAPAEENADLGGDVEMTVVKL